MQRNDQSWEVFSQVNRQRRAVREFTGESVDDSAMREILSAAQLAPSSFNLQLYRLHWIKDPETCKKMAGFCENQKAAVSAGNFVVVEAQWKNALATYEQFLEFVDKSGLYDEKSKAYYHGRKKQVKLLLKLFPTWLFSGFKKSMTLFNPFLNTIPFGRAGMCHWAARSSIYAAQTLMLAASAKGIQSCPMEGFKPHKVAKLLGIKKTSLITIVIALGHEKEGARKEPQWRLPFEKAVKIH